MTVMWWFAIGVGVALYLIAWRYLAGIMTWWESDGVPTTADVMFGIIGGFPLAVLAPFVFVIRCLLHRGTQERVLSILHTPEAYR